LEIHVLELPNFERSLVDLREPLDFWLYFLKNGSEFLMALGARDEDR
jgi:hypothetical protein